jgi:hypothetical protein
MSTGPYQPSSHADPTISGVSAHGRVRTDAEMRNESSRALLCFACTAIASRTLCSGCSVRRKLARARACPCRELDASGICRGMGPPPDERETHCARVNISRRELNGRAGAAVVAAARLKIPPGGTKASRPLQCGESLLEWLQQVVRPWSSPRRRSSSSAALGYSTMGAYLSKPVTEKTSLDCSSDSLTYGLSEMQGWRRSMEDAHIAQHALPDGLSMFAVFDGHGGTEVRRTHTFRSAGQAGLGTQMRPSHGQSRNFSRVMELVDA